MRFGVCRAKVPGVPDEIVAESGAVVGLGCADGAFTAIVQIRYEQGATSFVLLDLASSSPHQFCHQADKCSST
jgi:hypothetical protein